VAKEPSVRTGQALYDEDVLRADGVTDFSQYACVPGSKPAKIDWEMIRPRQFRGEGGVGGPPSGGSRRPRQQQVD